jgi:hypothetical protein
MNFSPQRLAQETEFPGPVMHVYGDKPNAFQGIGGVQLGMRKRQDATAPSYATKQFLKPKF